MRIMAESGMPAGSPLFGIPPLAIGEDRPALSSDLIEMFNELTEDLPEQIALLNEDWRLESANRLWTAAASEAGQPNLEVGGDYRRFWAEQLMCCPPTIAVRDGLSKFETGKTNSFRFSIAGRGEQAGLVLEVRLRRMRVQHQTIIVVASTDITELCDLRHLRDGFGELLIEGRAEERRRIARELHDSTMQLLTYLNLAIGRLKQSEPSVETLEIVGEMDEILRQAQAELRTLAYLAHPPLVEELGLHRALDMLVDGFSRRSGVQVTLDWHGNLTSDDDALQVPVYRIIQEALSNVYRHAHAESAIITVVAGGQLMEVRVTDDGQGMPQRPRAGVGISGMRARLKELGGNLTVRSSRSGTQLIAKVPRSTATPDLQSA